MLAVTPTARTATDNDLRRQLAAAQEAQDEPVVAELCQRIVASSPADDTTWSTLIGALLNMKEVDRAAAAVDACTKVSKGRHPPALENLRGDVALAQKDFAAAEEHWRAYLAAKPARSEIAQTWEKLGDLFVTEKRWPDVLEARTKQLQVENTVANHVARATALLRLHQWDAAYAEIHKANAMDASDAQVEEWLPQFERLQSFLPRIRALDAQLAKAPANARLLLDRARLFSLAGRAPLALADAQTAFKLQPNSMCARIQLAEAYLDTNQPKEAANLQVSTQLTREDGHVSEGILRELGALDAELSAGANTPAPLVRRAKLLRDLKQFTLALEDAQAALKLNESDSAAQFEVAHDFDGLDRTKEALAHAVRATELDPNDPVKWYYRGVLEAKRADFAAAIKSETRSLDLRESYLALRERENCARRIGDIARADADAQRLKALPEPAP